MLQAGQGGVEHIVIPIEQGFPGILQQLEKAGLHLVQYVEADEHIAVVAQAVGIQLLHHVTIYHALVGNARLGEVRTEVPVYVAQFVPKGDEFVLQLRAFFDGEAVEEPLDGLFLLLVEEVEAVHDVLQLLQVAEELVGIHQVLVHIVEVADEQFAPKVEIVKRLLAAGLFAEYLIEFAHQPNRVSQLQRGELAEQFTDADVSGRPDGTVCFGGQVFVEEQPCAFVRENDGGAREVVSYFGIQVFGDQLEKSFHIRLSIEN